MKYLYVRCNTRALENNPRVFFEICRGTPQDSRVFVNLVESCTVYTLHCQLSATPGKLLAMLDSAEACTPAQECIYGYLVSMLENMQTPELRLFLRFVTGASICLAQKITVTFHNVDGLV